jgi:hypothetical protein
MSKNINQQVLSGLLLVFYDPGRFFGQIPEAEALQPYSRRPERGNGFRGVFLCKRA